MRLFVAVTLPHEIRASLAALRSEIPRVRWVASEQLHVTLRFLGEVDEDTVAILRPALRKITVAAFSLQVEGVGTFGHPPRVLWCGLRPEREIDGLAELIDRAAVQVGLTPADHPFTAHLTLARLKNSPPVMVRRFLERHAGWSSGAFSITDFTLVESRLSSEGAIHSPLEVFPLGART